MSDEEIRRMVYLVKNLIEQCLQLYMNQKEVVETLLTQAEIEPRATEIVWQRLEEKNPEFFKGYYQILKLKQLIIIFKKLLEHHVQMMHQIHPTEVTSISTSNGSHIQPLHQNSACYVPEHTGPALKPENMQHPIGSQLHTNMPAAVDMSAHARKIDAPPAMLSTHSSNMGLMQGINGGMIKSEAGYSGSSPSVFGANENALDARPLIGYTSVASFSSGESNLQPLNDQLLDSETSSSGHLGEMLDTIRRLKRRRFWE